MPVPLTARAPVVAPLPSLDLRNEALEAEGKPKIEILVRVPTPYERDSFDAALVRAGVVYYSREQIRDLTIAAVAELHPPERFEDIRADLHELWQVGDAERKTQGERAQKFLELLEANKTSPDPLDEKAIAGILAEIKPEVTMDHVKRAKTVALQQDLLSTYQPLQKVFADLADQDTKRAWIQAETYVQGWNGLEHQPSGNGRAGLQRHEAEYLREQIQSAAWEELADFILQLHSIDGDTQKNLDSLLEKQPAPIGSTAQESRKGTGSESGNSTDSDSTATPAGGSPTTTARSSNSTKRTETKTVKSRRTRTAAAG